MKTIKIAVYAGSFDPLTNGHVWVINEALKIFDKLIVAIGINPNKKSNFGVEKKMEMIKQTFAGNHKIEVKKFDNEYLVDYAQKIGANFIVRGLRNSKDFEYEFGMCNINSDINSAITTVFLMPPRHLCEISSSMVKKLIGPKDWENVVKKYVPKAVFEELEKQTLKKR
jgi:pantetheine-phosphate adenylyltransferase